MAVISNKIFYLNTCYLTLNINYTIISTLWQKMKTKMQGWRIIGLMLKQKKKSIGCSFLGHIPHTMPIKDSSSSCLWNCRNTSTTRFKLGVTGNICVPFNASHLLPSRHGNDGHHSWRAVIFLSGPDTEPQNAATMPIFFYIDLYIRVDLWPRCV